MKRTAILGLTVAGLLAAACSGTVLPGGDDDAGADGGETIDSSSPLPDSGAKKDSGSPGDSGTSVDSGTDAQGPIDSGTTDSGVKVDSGTPVDAGGPKDSGVKPDASPLSCYDDSLAQQYVWQGPAAVNQNQCTQAQVTALINACYSVNATQATCDAFSNNAANKNCLRCFQGSAPGDQAADVKNLPPPVVLPITIDGIDYATLNMETCAAGVLNLPACGAPVSNILACEYGTCSSCMDPELDACLTESESKPPCSTILTTNQAACFTPIANNKATWEPACTGGQVSFEKVLPILAAKMCGP